MNRSSVFRLGFVAALVASTLAACGSSDSRDRNVAELKGCAQGGACQVGDIGPGGGLVVIGATEPGVEMWEVAPLNGYGTYLDAIGQLDDLNFGDVNGWTLPAANVNESIRNQLTGFACADDTDCATQFGDATYWTSDTQDGKHVVVSFADGSTSVADDDATHFIRPVRSFQMVPVDAETTLPSTTIEDTTLPDEVQAEESTTTAAESTTSLEESTTSIETTTSIEESTTSVVAESSTTTEPDQTVADDGVCAAGGTCEVGDIGPGGGIVFYASVAPFSVPGSACEAECHYLEAAQAAAEFSAASSCDDQSIPATIGTSSIGAGFANTEAIAQACGDTYVAATGARAYRGGGKNDWYLPSLAELQAMVKRRSMLRGLLGFAWSSTQSAPRETEWGSLVATTVGIDPTSGEQSLVAHEVRIVRPIRVFGGSPDAATTTTAVVATSSPTTVAPTPGQSCAKGGQCAAGDRGPGGGIVLLADAYDSDSVTLFEVAPTTWFANVKNASDAVGRMRLGGFGDWRMPTYSELAAMRAGRSDFRCAKAYPCITGFANAKYWGVSDTLGSGVLDFSSPTTSPSKALANELHYVRPVRTIEVVQQVQGQLVPVEVQPTVAN
ncbi:MAG: hypothetical protein RJB08_436 [Actinomycetota bacterium]|jgi:hypothetical protein